MACGGFVLGNIKTSLQSDASMPNNEGWVMLKNLLTCNPELIVFMVGIYGKTLLNCTLSVITQDFFTK